jgi:chromosome segregation ATPase
VAEQESVKKPYQEKLAEMKDEERVLEVKVTEKQKELEGLVRGIHSSANGIDDKFEEMNTKREKMDEAIKMLVEKRLVLEKERKDHQEKIEEFDKKLKMIEEGGKKRIREFHKEIKEWKRTKEKLSEKIENIEKKKEPLFVRFGQQADETRKNQEQLTVFYSQIDRSNERIGDIERQIKNL